jgi:Holliday junction DNA helicase RuvA
MIARLTGILVHKSPAYQIIDVQGVGYQVFTSLSTYYQLPELEEKVALRIYTHLREEALKLFGFATADEQSLFEKLIGVSKVGPKLALTILSGLNAGELVMAVTNHDIDKLSGIPGIGRKTAERLALEMKDKLTAFSTDAESSRPTSHKPGIYEDALSALINLGYKKPVAERAIKSVAGQNGNTEDLETLIKESLNALT